MPAYVPLYEMSESRGQSSGRVGRFINRILEINNPPNCLAFLEAQKDLSRPTLSQIDVVGWLIVAITT